VSGEGTPEYPKKKCRKMQGCPGPGLRGGGRENRPALMEEEWALRRRGELKNSAQSRGKRNSLNDPLSGIQTPNGARCGKCGLELRPKGGGVELMAAMGGGGGGIKHVHECVGGERRKMVTRGAGKKGVAS